MPRSKNQGPKQNLKQETDKKNNAQTNSNNAAARDPEPGEKNSFSAQNLRNVSKEKLPMITKTFEPKELLPFSQLRTLSQKDLINSLEHNDKLGIVIKDQLKVAMLDMKKYQNLVETAQAYERLLEWLEEQELFEQVGRRLNSNEWEAVPEGMSLMEWAGIPQKG